MANAITRLITWLHGEKVGEDGVGNVYYRAKKKAEGVRRRRWVVYSDNHDEASRVPPEYHAWLHYTVDDFPSDSEKRAYAWQQPHQPNLTGTVNAYRPPGHTLSAGQRDKATGDYEAWTPE